MRNNPTGRVRCFVCNQLVPRNFNESVPKANYSFAFLHVDKKRGCVCSSCIEKQKNETLVNSSARTLLSKRRIRCFSCKKLVLPHFNPNASSESYAVILLRVANKKGCLCANCIEENASKVPYTDSSNYSSPTETVQPIPCTPPQNGIGSSTREESSLPLSESQVSPTIETIYAKYPCLKCPLNVFYDKATRVIFGQENAIKKLVLSLYTNQMLNLLDELGTSFNNFVVQDFTGFKRRHVLLIGNTGTGKTLLATTIPKLMGLTHSVSNATPITAAGYVGEDLFTIVERLYDAANGDIEKAQRGVIILDEIDKKRHVPSVSGKDLDGVSVQQELLNLLEPSTIWIKDGSIPFKTNYLSVIMMGAFVGLEEIIEQRTKKKQIGFSADSPPTETNITIEAEDLIKYGFIPEFVGRIPCVCQLNKLTLEVATNIIDTLIKKYSVLFKFKEFQLQFDEKLISELAEKVVASPMGARSAENFVYKILESVMWNTFQSATGGECYIQSDGSAKITCISTKASSPASES